MAKKSEGELYEVTLLKDHTHEGHFIPRKHHDQRKRE